MIKNNSSKPLKIKIVSSKRQNEILQQIRSFFDEENKDIVECDESEVTDEELGKIRFTYKTENVNLQDFNYRAIKEVQDLINYLGEYLLKRFDGKPAHIKDGKLKYEPVALAIMTDKGIVTAIRSMKHLFGILKMYPQRRKIYFNIKPFFEGKFALICCLFKV